jgi:hypothetical protein
MSAPNTTRGATNALDNAHARGTDRLVHQQDTIESLSINFCRPFH